MIYLLVTNNFNFDLPAANHNVYVRRDWRYQRGNKHP